MIRTIIPARGRKQAHAFESGVDFVGYDKNHNPRKGTETRWSNHRQYGYCSDKNHNPRKGTETTFGGCAIKKVSGR